jgi:uncharacterized protein
VSGPPPGAADLIRTLDLSPHPEGGWYRETWRGRANDGGRAVGTAIYYLLVDRSPSRLHRVDADEVFHWYAGDTVELLRLGLDGESDVVRLGAAVVTGDTPQTVVPAGWWQGLRVVAPAGWALLGCTVSPGFEFGGFELASSEQARELVELFPEHRSLIAALVI